jgi:hypothetical protein
MATRPFALLADSTLTALLQAARSALDPWCDGWGVTQTRLPLSARPASDDGIDGGMAWRAYRKDDTSLWIGHDAGFVDELARALWNDACTQPGRIAAEAAAHAMEQLADSLAGLVGAPTDRCPGDIPAAGLALAGSGAACVTLHVGVARLCALLDGAATRGFASPARAGKNRALHARRAAVSDVAVRLQVELGRAEVELGSLLTLAPGQVLRLASHVDRPLVLVGSDDKAVLGGYLGHHDQQRALEITVLKHS